MSGFGEGGPAAGGGGWRFGRWWLAAQRGVEFDDKLEALDFVSNGLENLMTRDEKVSRLTCSLTPHVHMHARKTRTHVGVQH